MSSFRYQAARADGRVIRGVLDAPNALQAGTLLSGRGLLPITVALAPAIPARRSASRKDLALVFRSVAALVSAGVPLERAILATEPLASGALRDALTAARRDLQEGATLAQALSGQRGVMPELVIGIIRAGERGGRLGRALDETAAHLEQEAALVSHIHQALAYPLLLAVAGVASVLVIGTVVIPKFAVLLADLGEELPAATRILLATSGFFVAHGAALVLALAALVAVATAAIRQPAGRLRMHRILLGLPLIGTVRHALATTRLARALSGMLHAGMPLLPALQAAREATGDAAVSERVARAGERVARGEPLAYALERESAISQMALQLVSVGESSGRLADMCARAGDLAAADAERRLKTLVTLLEPAMVVFFGGLVAFVAAGLLQAVYSIRPGGAL